VLSEGGRRSRQEGKASVRRGGREGVEGGRGGRVVEGGTTTE